MSTEEHAFTERAADKIKGKLFPRKSPGLVAQEIVDNLYVGRVIVYRSCDWRRITVVVVQPIDVRVVKASHAPLEDFGELPNGDSLCPMT